MMMVGVDHRPGLISRSLGRREMGPINHRRLEITLDNFELLRLQVAALFTHNAAGRIVSRSKPMVAPAPRLFLGRSTGGNLWRYGSDVPDDLVAALEPLLAGEPVTERLEALPTAQSTLITMLAGHRPITEVYSGPAWRIPDDLPITRRVRLLTTADREALLPNYPVLANHLDAMLPCAAILEDRIAVTVCYSARTSMYVAEAGLDTIGAARGRGYGPDAVAAWAAAVRETGRLPLYSTTWDNLPARRVAEKLGTVQYGVDLSIY
jgi:hypothetical protein